MIIIMIGWKVVRAEDNEKTHVSHDESTVSRKKERKKERKKG